MIAKDALVAGVLEATNRVVQQIGKGDFQAALRSSADRRALLDELARQHPHEAENGFLRALRDAAKESDTALATISNDANRRDAGGRLCTKA